MGGVWAVTRQTFTQCRRMKVTIAFVALLALLLGAMPFVMKGDDTLAGKIRTFLDYGTTATGGLLTVVTVFLTVGAVSGDVRKKYVYTLTTKPLARWQYILGRWLGVTLFNAMLLAVAGAAIYGLAQHLRSQPAGNADDRRAVETEVFTSRRRVPPDPVGARVTQQVNQRLVELKRSGQYAEAVEGFLTRADGDREEAEELLREEIAKQVSESLQSAGPMQTLQWTFSGIQVEGTQTRSTGSVAGKATQGQFFYLRLEAPPRLTGKLTYGAPVRVNNTDGLVERIEEAFFDVRFMARQGEEYGLADLEEGDEVELVLDPTIQLTYQVQAARRVPDRTLWSGWSVLDPDQGTEFRDVRSDPVDIPTMLTLSARVVSPEGRTVATYQNLPNPNSGFATSVMIRREDVAVLYEVGSFEGNFLRGMLLLLIRLGYVAALGVLAGSLLSFPVGVFATFVVLPFGLARGFLEEATYMEGAVVEPGWFTVFGRQIVRVMRVLLPDLESTSPSDALVDGMHLSWASIGETAALTLAVRAALVILIACFVFHRRELARVQV